MEIHIGENYKVVSDKLNYILQEKRISNPDHPKSKNDSPQERWVDIGYFGKWEHLVDFMVEREIKLSKENYYSLEYFSGVIDKLKNELIKKLEVYQK